MVGAIILVFLCSSALSLYRLTQEFRPDRAEVRGTSLWFASEVNREYWRLLDMVTRFSHSVPGTTQDDVLLRLDLLWSQMGNFNAGAIGGWLDEITAGDDSIERLKALLTEMEPELLALQAGDAETGEALRRRLGALTGDIHRLVQTIDKTEQDYLIGVSFRTERSLLTLSFLLLSMTVSMAVLVTILVSETRRASHLGQRAVEAEKEVRKVNEDLEARVRDRTEDLRREITERKVISENLRKAEARFREIFEAADVGNFVLSSAGTIEESNSAAQEIFGQSSEQLEGQSIFGLIAPELEYGRDESPSLAETEKRLDSKAIQRIAVETQDGRELTLQMYVGQFQIGADPYFIVSISDITEQEKLRDQLNRSQRLETIGQLTGGVAHDFNNLLAVVLGNMELFRDKVEDAEDLILIDQAIDAVLRGSDLTKNMLSFARQAQLEPQTADLNQIVKGLKALISRTLPSSIELEISLLAGLWPVRADLGSVESAVLNLIINARDAMPGGGRLTIETSNERVDDDYLETRGEEIEPGRYVLLAVSDTGEGIAPDLVEKIFDPFFTTKPAGSGSGLGLSMLQGFMQQSNGTVRVYSEVGVGTTFKLYFPAGDHEVRSARKRQVASTEAGPNNGFNLLVVEDNPDVLRTLQLALEKEGHRVTAAASGDDALELFQSLSGIDLVLTDIVMPGTLQGTDLAKALRKLQPDLPMIFMSGYANEAKVHGNGLRPSDIRLMKPVRRKDLLEAISNILN